MYTGMRGSNRKVGLDNVEKSLESTFTNTNKISSQFPKCLMSHKFLIIFLTISDHKTFSGK